MSHLLNTQRPKTVLLDGYGYKSPPTAAALANGARNKAINAGARPVSNGG